MNSCNYYSRNGKYVFTTQDGKYGLPIHSVDVVDNNSTLVDTFARFKNKWVEDSSTSVITDRELDEKLFNDYDNYNIIANDLINGHQYLLNTNY